MRKNPLVGIFDSGIGGLTVLRECVAEMPNVRFLYYGDNEHVPYGSRTQEEIYSFVERAMIYFLRAGVNATVLACNTATAVAAERLRKRFPFPIVGMEPAVKPAAERCKNVLVLATPRTAESDRLKKLTERFSGRFHIVPAPGLAEAIERKLTQQIPFSLAEHLPKGEFDGVVLGCTHYVFYKREIAEFYGCETFDGNSGTAKQLKKRLNLPCRRGFKGKIGMVDHSKTNLYQNFNCGKMPKKGVIFVNKSQKINSNVFSEHLFL